MNEGERKSDIFLNLCWTLQSAVFLPDNIFSKLNPRIVLIIFGPRGLAVVTRGMRL